MAKGDSRGAGMQKLQQNPGMAQGIGNAATSIFGGMQGKNPMPNPGNIGQMMGNPSPMQRVQGIGGSTGQMKTPPGMNTDNWNPGITPSGWTNPGISGTGGNIGQMQGPPLMPGSLHGQSTPPNPQGPPGLMPGGNQDDMWQNLLQMIMKGGMNRNPFGPQY